MTVIKDIHDLISELLASRDGRKVATKILPIQRLISTVQSENAATQEKLAECLSTNIQLEQKISELEKEKVALKDTHTKEITNLKEAHEKEIANLTNKNKGDFHIHSPVEIFGEEDSIFPDAAHLAHETLKYKNYANNQGRGNQQIANLLDVRGTPRNVTHRFPAHAPSHPNTPTPVLS